MRYSTEQKMNPKMEESSCKLSQFQKATIKKVVEGSARTNCYKLRSLWRAGLSDHVPWIIVYWTGHSQALSLIITVLNCCLPSTRLLISPPDLQILVEPHDSLEESLLFGELLGLVIQISTDSEAVANTAEEVDLPRLARLDQSVLGLMTELGGEDAVGFC